jgi:hypothetical protein
MYQSRQVICTDSLAAGGQHGHLGRHPKTCAVPGSWGAQRWQVRDVHLAEEVSNLRRRTVLALASWPRVSGVTALPAASKGAVGLTNMMVPGVC